MDYTQLRPCDRCGVRWGDFGDGEISLDSHIRYHPMSAEVKMAYGIVAWLCYDCRKAWHKDVKNNILSKQYSEAMLEFEYWKSIISSKGEGNFEEGLGLFRKLDDLELKLNDFANEWLISQ